MACPDPNRIAELAQGTARADEKPALQAHLGSCSSCHRLFTGLVHSSVIGLSGEAAAPLERGARVDRYLVLHLVGAGAMGAVYSAYDPQLDRKVALKVLHAHAGQDRLVAEARAMARLAHPNVVPVLDLGTEQQRVFLAMEFVEGITLRAWLAEQPRSYPAIVRVLLDAGRGLAAAHAAGLTHRDFKPENILVGKDGRARVTDFGLARLGAMSGPAVSPSSAAAGTELGGTPAYMAPEQFQQGTVGPSADQFSFCIVLWEALFKQPPFELGNPPSVEHLAQAVIAGRTRAPPSDRPVPQWLRRILARGLRPNPDERFASMEALLEALGNDPAVQRRRFTLAAAAMLLLVALAGGSYRFATERRQLCTGAEQKLVGIWDERAKQRVRSAFLGTGLPYAQFTWNSIDQALDAYGRDWVAMHTEACEAARVRAEQSEEVLDLRMMCLSQCLNELKASVELFERGEKEVVEKAIAVSTGLSSLAGCADVEALKAPVRPPSDPARRAEVQAVRNELAQAITLERSGKYDDAVPIAQQLLERSKATAYLPLKAETLTQLARLHMLKYETSTAEKEFEEAFFTAQASGHDAIAARASAFLLILVGNARTRRVEATRWAKDASAVLQRSGGDDETAALLAGGLGSLFAQDGDHLRALEKYRESLAKLERAVGRDHPRAARAHNNISQSLIQLGRHEEALGEVRRSLEIWEKAYGPDHPETAWAHSTLGGLLSEQGRYPEAFAEFTQVLGIFEKTLKPGHGFLPMTHNNLSIVLEGMGQHEKAIAEARLGIALLEKYPVAGPNVLLGQGYKTIANVLLHQKKYDEALKEYGRALEIFEKQPGPEDALTAVTVGDLGLASIGLKAYGAAIAYFERALAIIEAKSPRPEPLAEFRFGLARALALANKDLPRAVRLAEQARENYAGIPSFKKEQADIDAWLTAHRGPAVSR
jgi:tetratricopeptide (TPR) repeat protein/predicted Ser/Thr protein kinase